MPRAIIISFLYRDAGNYKTRFDDEIDLSVYPKAGALKVGDEVTMGDFGTMNQSEFFQSELHPYKYRKRHDHNLLEVEEIQTVEEPEVFSAKAKAQVLKVNFGIGEDKKGYFTSGDFAYIKKCAKVEFGILIDKLENSLQADDNIRKYFTIA